MTLVKQFMIPEMDDEKLNAYRRQIASEHWPGDDRTPENESIRCRRTDILGRHNGFVIIGAIYEG